MTERAMTSSHYIVHDEARKRAAMHKIYSYLLRLAAQKRAADQAAAANQALLAGIDTPVLQAEMQEKCATTNPSAQVSREEEEAQDWILSGLAQVGDDGYEVQSTLDNGNGRKPWAQ
jgi:predicted house-cleaning NTP pyrophosphatase (Maf/HAM1 superfamily)